MKSNLFTLNWKDFVKGLVVAFFTALFAAFLELVKAGPFLFDWPTFQPIIMAGVAGILAYLSKNIITNSEDEIMKPDPK